MSASRLTADCEFAQAEALGALTYDPERSRLAVVRASRIGQFRPEAILHRHAGESGAIRDAFQQRIILIRRANRPAAAMDMKIQAARIVRRDDAQLNGTGGPGDRRGFGAR